MPKRDVKPEKKNHRIRNTILAGTALVATAAIGLQMYSTTPGYIARYVLDSKKQTASQTAILKDTKKARRINSDEARRDLETILFKAPFTKNDIVKAEYLHSHEVTQIDFEKDIKYAQQLMRLGKDSADHLFEYINSPFLERENVEFHVPQKDSDIKVISQNGLVVYYVADVRNLIFTTYRVSLRDGRVALPEVKSDRESAGQYDITLRVTATENGFKLDKQYTGAIFISTSAPKILQAESLAIELLHNSLRPYTTQYIAKSIQNGGRNGNALDANIEIGMSREEIFTHALSILWFKQYNEDENLGFSEQDIRQRVEWYDSNAMYKGVNEFAKKLPGIGVKKAVELYVTNPDELFK